MAMIRPCKVFIGFIREMIEASFPTEVAHTTKV
jgi:hypothetical protein